MGYEGLVGKKFEKCNTDKEVQELLAKYEKANDRIGSVLSAGRCSWMQQTDDWKTWALRYFRRTGISGLEGRRKFPSRPWFFSDYKLLVRYPPLLAGPVAQAPDIALYRLRFAP